MTTIDIIPAHPILPRFALPRPCFETVKARVACMIGLPVIFPGNWYL